MEAEAQLSEAKLQASRHREQIDNLTAQVGDLDREGLSEGQNQAPLISTSLFLGSKYSCIRGYSRLQSISTTLTLAWSTGSGIAKTYRGSGGTACSGGEDKRRGVGGCKRK